MNAITNITGKGLSLPGNDIDTDRVIPARYLKEITFSNMGNYLFYDARFDENETPKEHPLNNLKYKDASIIVVNKNFGCGSSREHAPQSIKRYGFNAIIGESFAEIFAGNCLQIGLPVVTASAENIVKLQHLLDTEGPFELTLDLRTKTVNSAFVSIPVELPESRQKALLDGSWDVLATLKQNTALIKNVHNTLPYFT